MTVMTTNISEDDRKARESARHVNGTFGEQHHTAADPTLNTAGEKTTAIDRLATILGDDPELAAQVRESLAGYNGDFWRPELIYVEQGDKLMPEQLDAFLQGDDSVIDDIESTFQDSEGYWNAIREYATDTLGIDLDDLDFDTEALVREWIQEEDRSSAIPGLIRGTGDALIQLPAADDDAFGQALQEASEQDEAERYAAIEKVFHDTLVQAGIELTDDNKLAVRSLIDENSLDFGAQYSEQWQLRLVTYTDPSDVSMSWHSTHEVGPRALAVTDPWLLLVDPWNGRSHDVKLTGTYATSVSVDRPARLDSQLGYGSLDNIAGVVHSAYRTDVTIKEEVAA